MTLWMGSHGYPKPLQAAVLDYVKHESGFEAGKIVSTGACLFQWAGVRRRRVLALGGGVCPAWEAQMGFMDRELRGEDCFRPLWARPERFRDCFGMMRC